MQINKLKYFKTYFLCTLAIISCNTKYSKKNHIGTSKIANSIYLEVYSTYEGGVFAGNSYSYYLTDSVNFRELVIAVNNDDETIKRDFKDGLVYFYKIASIEDTIEVKVLDINKLAKNGKWD